MPFSIACNVLSSKPRRMLSASMFFSPTKAFDLFFYAEELAQIFSNAPSLIRLHNRPYNPNVVASIDFESK